MSSDALKIYSDQLKYNMGENGAFTEEALYDPDTSLDSSLFGIFDSTTFRETGKDTSGNVAKNAQCFFMVFEAPDFDIYENKKILFIDRAETYTIKYVDKDKNGVQVLWLS